MELIGKRIDLPVIKDSDWPQACSHPAHYVSLHLGDGMYSKWQDSLAGLGVLDTQLWLGNDISESGRHKLRRND